MKNCPKVYKNCQSKLEILPNTKLTLSKWPKFLNDVCQSDEISPNLVTLAAAHPTSPVLFSWMKRFDLLQLPLASLHCQFFFEASSNPHVSPVIQELLQSVKSVITLSLSLLHRGQMKNITEMLNGLSPRRTYLLFCNYISRNMWGRI